MLVDLCKAEKKRKKKGKKKNADMSDDEEDDDDEGKGNADVPEAVESELKGSTTVAKKQKVHPLRKVYFPHLLKNIPQLLKLLQLPPAWVSALVALVSLFDLLTHFVFPLVCS